MLPGELLLDFCNKQYDETVFICPFIKVSTLEKILSRISESVDVSIFTRWRIDEILAGVSDLDVWKLVDSRYNTKLYIHPNVHAKIYRFSDVSLVGSANMTDAGLGWSRNSNLEMLVPVKSVLTEEVEASAKRNSIEINFDIYRYYKEITEALKDENIPLGTEVFIHNFAVHTESEKYSESEEKNLWLPMTRDPEILYTAYSGKIESLSEYEKEYVLYDLHYLSVPAGFSKKLFFSYSSAQLLNSEIVKKIDSIMTAPRRFGEIRDYLKLLLQFTKYYKDANTAWQTLMRWMLFFLPQKYELKVPHYSEIIYRKF